MNGATVTDEADVKFQRAPIGSIRLKSNGHGCVYHMVKVAHPNRWEYEHRVVAEMMLGRRLLSDEVVHHINGDTLDNRPENLKVWFRDEHGLHHYYADDVYFPYGLE